MIDAKGLVSAGYRRFQDQGNSKGEGHECLWQKKVEDRHGLRYHISIDEWRLERVIRGYAGLSPSFEAKVQFTRGDGDRDTVDVLFHCGRKHSLADVEAFFDEAWTKMGFAYYEKRGWDATEAEAPSVPVTV